MTDTHTETEHEMEGVHISDREWVRSIIKYIINPRFVLVLFRVTVHGAPLPVCGLRKKRNEHGRSQHWRSGVVTLDHQVTNILSSKETDSRGRTVAEG